jgi:hypothetical protein
MQSPPLPMPRLPDRHGIFHQCVDVADFLQANHLPSLSIHPTRLVKMRGARPLPSFPAKTWYSSTRVMCLIPGPNQPRLVPAISWPASSKLGQITRKVSRKESGGVETGSPLLYRPNLGQESDFPPMERHAHSMGSTKCRSPRPHNRRKPCPVTHPTAQLHHRPVPGGTPNVGRGPRPPSQLPSSPYKTAPGTP